MPSMPVIRVATIRIAPHAAMRCWTRLIWLEVTARSASRKAGEHVALGLDEIGDAQDVVVQVLEVGERGVADRRGFLAQERAHDLAQRQRGATERQERLAEREQLARAPTPEAVDRVVEHRGLDVVHGVVDDVGDAEVAVDHDVEQRPEQKAFVGAAVLATLRHEPAAHELDREVADVRRVVLEGLAHRDEPALTEHDVDLARRELVAVEPAVVDRDVEVVRVVIELRALPGVAEILEDELVQAEGLSDDRELFVGGLGAVDPDDRVGW